MFQPGLTTGYRILRIFRVIYKEGLDRARKQQEELLQARMQLVGGGSIVQQRMKIRREP